jgi:ELWxxDGT repeat protein
MNAVLLPSKDGRKLSMRGFLVARAAYVGALGLVLVAVGCSGGDSSGSPPADAGSADGAPGGPDGGGADSSGPGGGDGATADAHDGSAPPMSDGGGGTDAPAWTGFGVLATGVTATSFTAIGSTVYFGATEAAHGNELWTTDLTPQGTALVYDACSGSCDGYAGDIVQVNGHTLFGSKTSATPGTLPTVFVLPPSGTPTPLGSNAQVAGVYEQGYAGSTFVFGTQFGLWATDGTTAGTTTIAGLGNDHAETILGIGTRAIFSAYQGGTSPSIYDLWGTDGTSAGTAKLETGNATSRTLECVSNGKAYVVANNVDLTVTDGTPAGTHAGLGGFTSIGTFGVMSSGTVIFEASGGTTATTGLYATDGTTVTMIGPEGPGYDPINLGSVAVFPSVSDIVVTDGTAGGTMTLKSFAPNFVRTIAAAGTYAYFFVMPYTAMAGVQPQLWKTDGTAAGTTLVTTMAECPASGCGDLDWGIYEGSASGNTLVFETEIGPSPLTFHLWSTQGTAATTHVISPSVANFAFLPVGSGVLFSTTANDLRYEPF